MTLLDRIEKNQENLSKILNTFENIMENGAWSSIFHNIFKYVVLGVIM